MSNSRLVGTIFLLLFGAYGYFATDIPLDFWSEDELFNARSLPYAIAIVGTCISLLLIIIPSPETEWRSLQKLDWVPAILLLIAMSVYGLIFEYLGFIVSTILFLMTSYAVLGERRLRWMTLGSVPLVIGFWLLMDFLGIYLDPGELFLLIKESADA